jgi:hypothetical protein
MAFQTLQWGGHLTGDNMEQVLKNKTLSQIVKKNKFSYFWNGLLGVQDIFLSLGKFKLNNGTQIRFS